MTYLNPLGRLVVQVLLIGRMAGQDCIQQRSLQRVIRVGKIAQQLLLVVALQLLQFRAVTQPFSTAVESLIQFVRC